MDKSDSIVVAGENTLSIYDKLNRHFKSFTSYGFEEFNSINAIIRFLHSPRDGSSLAVARIFYGLAMMIDTVEERSGSELDTRWGDERDCRFTLFPFVQPTTMPRMGVLYGIMFLGALGICLGYKFTTSCLMYAIPYWYLILLDKSVWNNHSYLFGLMAILFTCSSANRCFSLDSFFQQAPPPPPTSIKSEDNLIKCPSSAPATDVASTSSPAGQCVPFWNYFIIKFQYFVLYTLAGVYKLCPEWLTGYAMAQLGNHWVFTPFRLLLGTTWTDLLVIHWFGCLFDLTVAFWLTYKGTRVTATVFAVSFHLMNSRLFTIGMFPWLCLAHLPLFYEVDWPRKLMGNGDKRQIKERCKGCGVGGDGGGRRMRKEIPDKEMEITVAQKRTTFLLGIYIFLQLFLPNSHFITKGYNNWTKGLYGYSWNMMVNSWQPVLTSIKIVDNVSNKTLYMDPTAFTENSRWTRHADMAKQYAECIRRNLLRSSSGPQEAAFDFSSGNISIYLDIWCSMNGRFQQRVFDPRVDILRAEWSPFSPTPWLLPIISQFTRQRPRLRAISEHVFSWSNHSDVLFIADFPGLSLDNYVAQSATNVSLTVLEGSVRLTYDGGAPEVAHHQSQSPVTLSQGQSVAIQRESFHNVLVVGDSPAAYMYTYTNATMASGDEASASAATSPSHHPLATLWRETGERWHKFQLFFQHVLNCLLHEIYGVPMPHRQKEH